MSLVKSKVPLKPDLHQFANNVFGSLASLIDPANSRAKDTLFITCSELGSAPDCMSFGDQDKFLVLQHLAASIPTKTDCEVYVRNSFEAVRELFSKHEFRHVVICGHLGCGVIRYWLQSSQKEHNDVGGFRQRFERGAKDLVDNHYAPSTVSDWIELMIFEHVLCQIDNLLTHPFVMERVKNGKTSMHGWVLDDETARVFGYCPNESAFVLI